MNTNIIHHSARICPSVKIGRFCIIERDVVIGAFTIIGDYVKLMPDTHIGNNCRIDDYVNTSGHCIIGDNVTIKRCTMIGRATKIENDVWIGSGVSTTRLKYPDSNIEEWVTIKERAQIGTKALLLAGTTIGEGAIIGAGAIISKDCEPYCIYIGIPAKLHRRR